MAWGRILVAILLTLLVGAGIFGVAAAMNPSFGESLRNLQAPGIGAADRAALGAPYRDLVAARYDAIVDRLAEVPSGDSARAELTRMHALLPKEPGDSSRLLQWTAMVSTQASKTLVGRFEHVYPRHVVLVNTRLMQVGGAWRIVDFRINVATKAELAANAFTLKNRPPAFIAFIALTVVIPLFIWATAMSALFVPQLKRRTLWVIFILIGLVTFRLNSATNALEVQPLSFQLFGASAFWSGSAFDAWVFGLSIPVGAVLYWIYRASRDSVTSAA